MSTATSCSAGAPPSEPSEREEYDVTASVCEFELVASASGALAVRDRSNGEVMHPNGPALESERLYVEPARLRERLAEGGAPLRVLDVGLGAGTNAIAAWRAAERLGGGQERAAGSGRVLEMLSFERTLAPLELALTQSASFGLDEEESAALRALLAGGYASPRVRWSLRLDDLRTQLDTLPDGFADVVFWDPWSPRVHPELWGATMFTRLRRVCGSNASVHTFSAATPVRVALLLAGFAVGYGPALGTKQKRSTVASTQVGFLDAPLDHDWLRSLSPSAFPLDAPTDALARLYAAPQF